MISRGYDVSKKPVFMRVCGHHPNGQFAVATFLQHLESKKYFATDEIIISGFAVKLHKKKDFSYLLLESFLIL